VYAATEGQGHLKCAGTYQRWGPEEPRAIGRCSAHGELSKSRVPLRSPSDLVLSLCTLCATKEAVDVGGHGCVGRWASNLVIFLKLKYVEQLLLGLGSGLVVLRSQEYSVLGKWEHCEDVQCLEVECCQAV
jgi:hypothetical protein